LRGAEILKGSFWRTVLKKSFLGDERNFLGPLMRSARDDVRGPHRFAQKRPPTIGSALQIISAAETSGINFGEILGVVRFSTFSTVSAQSGRTAILVVKNSASQPNLPEVAALNSKGSFSTTDPAEDLHGESRT
jgi:hypothetical protein